MSRIFLKVPDFRRRGSLFLGTAAFLAASMMLNSCGWKFTAADSDKLDPESGPRDWAVQDSLESTAKTYEKK